MGGISSVSHAVKVDARTAMPGAAHTQQCGFSEPLVID